MNRFFVLLCLLVIVVGCGQSGYQQSQKPGYRTIDYVTVGKMMGTVKLPHVIKVSYGKKRPTLLGCDHIRDTGNRQFAVIRQCFNSLKPQIAFNEGGQIADSVRFQSYTDGILKYGETGALKYLSDMAGIKMMNGDITDSLEFKTMLSRYPKNDLLLYYTMERLVIPQLSGAYGNEPIKNLYEHAVEDWFVRRGFPLQPNERTWAYFKRLYKKSTGHNFMMRTTPDIELFDYVNGGNCKFCGIGRASKMLRDSILLNKIDRALKSYDRIIVTFGYGHSLAIEPALKELIYNH